MTASASDALLVHCQLQRPGFTLKVELSLPGSGVTALFGASGSGKTTCLRILAGLEPGATGRVVVNGEVWQDSERRIFRPVHQRAVGYVFQEASLFDHLTVQGNLTFGFDRTPVKERRHHWDHAIDLLGIGELLSRKPHELSGGERQRVAIARALAACPRVLLMDEPLAALDAQRKADILPWLEQLHEQLDIPVVYVTHSLDEVTQLADHLVVLEQGEVLAAGPAMSMLGRLDLPLAHQDDAATVIEAVIGAPSDDVGLCQLDFSAGSLWLPQTRAVPRPAGTRVRVRIPARDVSVALERAHNSSVLNILSATVQRIEADGRGQVLVEMQLGHAQSKTRLLSRISQISARRLELEPGKAVFAQIKGVAIVR